MQVIYAKQPFPTTTTKSIFLAGPTPRSTTVSSWRDGALGILRAKGYDGIVFVPEPADGVWKPEGYDAQVEWEEAALKRSDCILFWIPRNMKGMPGLTTNDEFGVWKDSGKVVLGAPDDAQAVRYQQHYAKKLQIPTGATLDETIDHAIAMVGKGALREGGECEVPLNVWKHKTFQGWLQAQKGAGNRLDGANILWTFRAGPKRDFMFAWIAHVNVFIASENRNKVNEFVFGRTDISGVVMYHRPFGWFVHDPMESLMRTEVVIIREFRSPARTHDGFIWEVTAGSSKDTEEGTLSVAVHEVEEESGVKLSPTRLRKVAVRQMAGTLSAHQATVYAVELTTEEMAEVKRTVGTVRGVEADSERTYAEVRTLGQLLDPTMPVDWSTLGMVLSSLLPSDV